MVRSYYRLTKLETSKDSFTKELHRMVIEEFPELRDKTVQNIIDQRRSIFRNNRIPAETIDRIKTEVALELGMNLNNEPQEQAEEQVRQETTDHTEESNRYEDEFVTSEMCYAGMEPTARPKLPNLIFKPGTGRIMNAVDDILRNRLLIQMTLEEVHEMVYLAAVTTLKLNKQKVGDTGYKHSKHKEAPWEKRISNRIVDIRAEIGTLTQFMRGNKSSKVTKAAMKTINKYRSTENPSPTEILDLLKQKLAATSKRLKRLRQSNNRRKQNALFSTNEKLFYKSLEKPTNTRPSDEYPDVKELRNYWSNIWSEPVYHKQPTWIAEERRNNNNLKTMLQWKISLEDVEKAIRKAINWKAPGPDNIHNFWFKKFKSTHKHLARCFTNILDTPHLLPSFMTKGTTYLLPKTPNYTKDPAKYRPITCLPTLYKLLTSIISNKIYSHLEENNLLEEEQKGCRKGSRGCKEQLVIDSVIMAHAEKKKNTLHTAYVDYRKAFDSVPHSWLREILKIYKIENHTSDLLTHAMNSWSTTLIINNPNGRVKVDEINIRRGIFQGDALSPLWFCLALKPLTRLLNAQSRGYTISNAVVSHLFYMDDIKLFAGREEDMKKLLNTVGQFSTDIKMQFGLEKCKTNSMTKGKWRKHPGQAVQDQGIIQGMEEHETYKYLGYHQGCGIKQKESKEQVTSTYTKRLRAILKSDLSARNKSKAVNTYATSIMTYSLGILKWTNTELQELDRLTRKEYRRYRSHHPTSSLIRFHLPRSHGGRGVPSIHTRHYQQVLNLRKYFMEKAKTSPLHQAIVTADTRLTPLNLADNTYSPEEKIPTIQQQKQQWREKTLHGKYLATIEHPDFDTVASLAWLSYGNMFNETEGFIVSIQDQVINTRSYRKRVMKEDLSNTKCRMCGKSEERLEHIIAGCSTLAHKQYLERHNTVAKITHQALREKYMNYTEILPAYKYEPPIVCEDNNTRIYWNRKIITDKPIPNNIPDIVLTRKDIKITYIIDIAVPLAVNAENQYKEKINKYLPLADEVKVMWNMNTVRVIPVVLGCTGEIPKKMHTSIKDLEIPNNIYVAMQKAVILHTCNIVRRVLGGTYDNGISIPNEQELVQQQQNQPESEQQDLEEEE